MEWEIVKDRWHHLLCGLESNSSLVGLGLGPIQNSYKRVFLSFGGVREIYRGGNKILLTYVAFSS